MTRVTFLLGLGLINCTLQICSAGGVPVWTNRYDGPAGGNDYDTATAIAIDNNGNVFVAGAAVGNSFDFAVIKYDANGALQWTNLFGRLADSYDHAVALAADTDGNCLATGSAEGYNVTIKYSPAGVPLWTNFYRASGTQSSGASALAVDGSGKAFVTGSSSYASGERYVTIAYSSEGGPLWTNFGPTGYNEAAIAIAVDSSTNVVVSGYSFGSSADLDYETIKYSGAGAALWTNRYNGTGSSSDLVSGVVVDSDDNCFVTGQSGGDYTTIKYSPAGVPLWTNRYTGPGSKSDQATALAVDCCGNVVVTGSSALTNNGPYLNDDFITIKYSSGGLLLWTKRYDGPAGGDDRARAIAVDNNGNVFVAGYSLGTGTGRDFVTIAYTSSGAPLWTNRYTGPGDGEDDIRAIAVDRNGNVLVTGNSKGGSTGFDFVTIKYSTSLLPAAYLDFEVMNNQLLARWTNAGFGLQASPNITGPFTNVPGATSPYTNSITGAQQFFRLATP